MKKFILAAVAAAITFGPVAATVAEAQPRPEQHRPGMAGPDHRVAPRPVARPPAPQYRTSWRKGERFDQRQARNYRQIDYRKYRGLRAPPRGYRYVQSGNDAVLVGITSGLVSAVIAGAIR